MRPADKAKRTMIVLEIPRDELACRIAEAAMGAKRTALTTPSEALAQLDAIDPGQAARWRASADRAVMFFHECINAASQPS